MRKLPVILLGLCIWTTAGSATLFASPAPALSAAPGDEATIRGIATQPEDGLVWGAALAARASQPSPTRAFEALLAAADAPATAQAWAPAALAGVPFTLAEPLGNLVGAATTAEALRAEAVSKLTPEEVAFVLQGGLRESHALPAPSIAAPAGAEGQLAYVGTSAPQAPPEAQAIAANVDMTKMAAAALTILAATEQALPALRAFPGPHTQATPTCPGVTGSVLYESANCLVIVGDTGINTYNALMPALVLVDMGGNDLYLSTSAASASGSVKVVVDVGGSDVYAASTSASGPGVGATTATQGFGTVGVGVLVDADGVDSYTATAATVAPQPGPIAGQALVTAQGSGVLGVGVLADLGNGANAFTARADSDGGQASVMAQGGTGLGVGALLNLGAGGDDRYNADATSTLHLVTQSSNFSTYNIGPATVSAHGGSELGGVTALVDAGGNDRYHAQANGGSARAIAQGAADAGAGVMVDAGGNDNLEAKALGDTTLTLITTNPNVCWTVTVTVGVADSLAAAQGAANIGVGALVDASGIDTRATVAQSNAGAIAGATSSLACLNTATATATSGNGQAVAQGAVLTAGAAVLVDGSGNDANSMRGTSQAFAKAIATSPGTNVESATPTAGAGTTRGQGFTGIGAAVDVDGDGADTYDSFVDSRAIKQTSAGVTTTLGSRVQNLQGFDSSGGLGIAFFLDLNGRDTYTTNPAGATLAIDNFCWTNLGSPNQARGRDWTATTAGFVFACN